MCCVLRAQALVAHLLVKHRVVEQDVGSDILVKDGGDNRGQRGPEQIVCLQVHLFNGWLPGKPAEDLEEEDDPHEARVLVEEVEDHVGDAVI